MGVLKTGLKLVGSAALGTIGVASTLLRQGAYAVGSDELANFMGSIQDASFNTIQDMWTSDEKKTSGYYEDQMVRSVEREESAARSGEAQRRDYERMKERVEKEKER